MPTPAKGAVIRSDRNNSLAVRQPYTSSGGPGFLGIYGKRKTLRVQALYPTSKGRLEP